jgi:hypothetical protein
MSVENCLQETSKIVGVPKEVCEQIVRKSHPQLFKKKGRVYIASMNMRGAWADPPYPTIQKVNVTSAQATASTNRRDFSPMTAVPGGYKGYWCFENYWQSGKVFDGIPHSVSKSWYLAQKEPKRRYPKSKGLRVLHASFDGFPPLDYVSSRKKVYIPEYINLIKDREMLHVWKKYVNDGNDIAIYDFDGPRGPDGSVMCLEVTLELLQEKLNNASQSFGHGYIVASLILDIDLL